MALCNYCGKFSLKLVYREDYCHQPSFEALQKSADAGCPLCKLIYRTLSMKLKEKNVTPKQDNSDSHVWIERHPDKIGVLVDRRDQLGCRVRVKEDMVHAYLDMVTSSDDPAAEYIKARPIRPNPSDDELFELIKHWLYECNNDHPNPSCRAKSAPLPTRVLDVGPADGSQEPHLFRSRGETGDYLTLSYCWGSSRNVRTLNENFEAYLKEIKYVSLPKSIQHAIDITRKLQYQYLWVDALCIIQDSRQDWNIESLKMAEIYGNSFLTIAAEAASDCSQGIFFTRTPRVGVQVPFFLDGELPCGSVTLHNEWDHEWNYKSAPLQSRSWTFQERVLSRRVVAYGSHMLKYTCRHTHASENEGLSDPDTPLAFMFRLFRPKYQYHAGSMTPEDSLSHWYDWVTEYSQRTLTYETDKLPAVSGLAHVLEKTLRCPYRAGLWECDLVYGLLWHTSYKAPGMPAISMRRPWRAPSWSWASLDEEICWDTFPTPIMARHAQSARVANLIATTHPLQADPTGQVSGGTLTLEGSLRAARWIPKACIMSLKVLHTNLLQYEEILVEAAASDADTATDQGEPGQEDELPISTSGSFVRMFAICRFDDSTDRPEHVWCLLLTSGTGPDNHPKPDNVWDASEAQESDHLLDELIDELNREQEETCTKDTWTSEEDEWEREQSSARDVPKPDDPLPVDGLIGSGRGIMLVPTDSGTHNEYRRVGYFELDGRQGDWPTNVTKVTIV